MNAISIAIAVEIASEVLGGEPVTREIAVMCAYCLEELDPRGEWSVHRAPDNESCPICGCEKRTRMGGMLFVVRPKPGIAGVPRGQLSLFPAT